VKGRAVVVTVAMLVASGLSACGERDRGIVADVEAAIAKTERQSRRFLYTEDLGQRNVAVRGAIEDDFRFEAAVQENNLFLLEQVIRDDAIATRLQEPDALGSFASSLAAAPPETVEALKSKKWVVDSIAAPSLLLAGNVQVVTGDDPVYDALTVFNYVRQVLRQQDVRKFDENSLDYRPKEDPFPKPKESSDVDRYDFVPGRLPRSTDLAGGGVNQAVPAMQHFRKMAIYVRNGSVIRVLEDIDVVGRLDDLRRNYDLNIDGTDTDRAVEVAILGINEVRQGQGLDLIRVRKMSFGLKDIGGDVKVDLPEDDVVAGDLSFLKSTTKRRGAKSQAPTASTVPPVETAP